MAPRGKERTHSETRPRVLDLFCGAGGLSVGFDAAGYKIVGGIDNNEIAVKTFTNNIADAKGLIRDLRKSDFSDIKDFVGPSGVDIIIGGPACQGFSTSGGLSRTRGRDDKDPRNQLFVNYLEIVDLLRPSWILFENVPGLLLYDNGRVALEIARAFREIGYAVVPMILLAADFGVPQLRRRLVFVGNRTGSDIAFPTPTHGNSDLWKNYALPFAHLSRIGHGGNAGALAHVTFDQACGDLPPLAEGQTLDRVPYAADPASAFQIRIRVDSPLVRQHVADTLPPLDRFAAQILKPGENWRHIPSQALPDRFRRIRPYDATTCLRRLRGDQPAYTITTKFNEATTGAFIHPTQARTLTLREAARIQSFPDRFVFEGTAGQIRHQIGNAVPPLLSQCLAEAIKPFAVRDIEGVSSLPVRDVVIISNGIADTDILRLKAPRRPNLLEQEVRAV
ncbi:MAG TPA: DNA cytosine methyltransferase [Stellaceae bacterium]|nr:DNA cytosine methyltransferase [Stellaceae bacterium]